MAERKEEDLESKFHQNVKIYLDQDQSFQTWRDILGLICVFYQIKPCVDIANEKLKNHFCNFFVWHNEETHHNFIACNINIDPPEASNIKNSKIYGELQGFRCAVDLDNVSNRTPRIGVTIMSMIKNRLIPITTQACFDVDTIKESYDIWTMMAQDLTAREKVEKGGNHLTG